MFNGAHIVIYSTNAEADRIFLRDVLNFSNVDVGGGWLIFALPPAELAFHPHNTASSHELFLMCDDIAETRESLIGLGVSCDEVADEGWGLLSGFTLPGGGKVGFYQPRHERPVPSR